MGGEVTKVQQDRAEPLTYSSGKIKWSDAFISSKPLEMIKPQLRGVETRPRDLGMFLYFVYAPTSPYHKWPIADRVSETIKERIIEKDWITQVMSSPEGIVLVDYYRRLVLSPGQKLYFGLIEQIERFRQEISNIDADASPEEAVKRIKQGQELLKSEKEIQAIISNESSRKVWGGYEPNPFELPPEER